MHIRTRFHDCFNVYNILFDEEKQQYFKQVRFASCISYKSFKFSVYELLKFRHIAKSNTRCCLLHVATITLFWLVTFIQTYKTYTYAHTHKHKHKHTHTHTHTHTHRFKFCDFLERSNAVKLLGKLREIN